MIKIIFTLNRPPHFSVDEFQQQLLGPLSKQLTAQAAVKALQLNLADGDVAQASALRQEHSPPAMDAMISLWIDGLFQRQHLSQIIVQGLSLDGADTCISSSFNLNLNLYAVAESEPIAYHRDSAPAEGQRSAGFSQVAMLSIPAHINRQDWFQHWLNVHTEVAIETQSTVRYLQNKIVYADSQINSANSNEFVAIVEECFPAAAMNNPAAFFNAGDDEQLLQSNVEKMMASCMQFIDFETINVVPTSEYIIKPLSINP